MTVNKPLFLISLLAGLALPGEAAYTGAYIAMGAALVGIMLNAWSERSVLVEAPSLAIFTAIALVSISLLFVYRSESDLLGPVFLLPMLTSIGVAMMARPGARIPGPILFAAICLAAATVAVTGGLFESIYLNAGRVGLANNPIHYGSIAAMVGGLALVGVVSTSSRWRYFFLMGPVFGIGAAILSGSRGPLAGAVAIAAVGVIYIIATNWNDRWLRRAVFAVSIVTVAVAAYLITAENSRVLQLFDTAFDIFRFTGGSDDIRAAMYASAVYVLQHAPAVGVGYGQLSDAAQALYPNLVGKTDNLHADWANFAAMAGVPGLLAWLLVLSSPFLLLLDPSARQDRPIVLGALILVTGQSVLGVSNSMFGVLPQTVVFAVGLGFLMARLRALRSRTE